VPRVNGHDIVNPVMDSNQKGSGRAKVARRLRRIHRLALPGEVFAGDATRWMEQELAGREILDWWRSLLSERLTGASPQPLSFYLHVPFCRSRCRYCQFDSLVPADDGALERFVGDMEEEARCFLEALGPVSTTTVAVGGGTPSLLTEAHWERLTRALFEGLVHRPAGAYFSVEMNPDTTTAGKVAILAAAGANRLSLGVQSLSEDALRKSGRSYQDLAGLERAVRDVRTAPSLHLNLDLLAPLAGETFGSFREGVEGVLALDPDAVTLYRYQSVIRGGQRLEPGLFAFEAASRELIEAGEAAGYGFRLETRTATILMRRAPEWADSRYEHHPDTPASIMAFGPFGESHVYGHGLYRTVFRDDGGMAYRGTRVSREWECRSYAARLVARMQPIDRVDFERRFGRDPGDLFRDEFGFLEEVGRMELEKETIRPLFRDAAEAGLYAGLMFDDETIEHLARLQASREHDRLNTDDGRR